MLPSSSLPLSLLARSARVARAVTGHPEDALETVSLTGLKAARRNLCNSNEKNLLLTRTRVQPRCAERNTWYIRGTAIFLFRMMRFVVFFQFSVASSKRTCAQRATCATTHGSLVSDRFTPNRCPHWRRSWMLPTTACAMCTYTHVLYKYFFRPFISIGFRITRMAVEARACFGMKLNFSKKKNAKPNRTPSTVVVAIIRSSWSGRVHHALHPER